MKKENITLIGMPGAGKSTVGVVLAKVLGYRFLDSDLEIQERTGKLLHELISGLGDEGFLELENQVHAGLQVTNSVIATGGSAVYGKEAMEHLREISTVVYLRLPWESLMERLGDLHERGVVLKPGQTLKELMDIRGPLYEKYAHLIIEEENLDIRGVVKLAKAHGIRTYIDNTFCTPLYQKPLTMGIDISMHTISKYIGGHSDIIGGILVVKDEELERDLRDNIRQWFGGILGPMEAWLAIRGLRTLELRAERHQQTAMAVAEFLEGHPKVEKVYYSGLASHPQAELIHSQQTGHTGLMSFTIHGGLEPMELVDHLKVFEIGCSWGGFESLALCPLVNAEKEELDFLSLREKDRGLIRIHCGLEGTEVLIEDLRQALEKI